MNGHYSYIAIDILTVLFPFLLSFDKKVAFYKQWKNIWPGMLLTGIYFIAFDVFYTRAGVWKFHDEHILGPKLLDLPIEEWIFFFFIPYSCIFIYACLRAYFDFTGRDRGWSWFFTLGTFCCTIALLYHDLAHTLFSFGTCGAFFLIVFLLRNKLYTFRSDAFLVTVLIALVPFLLVNGLLTWLPVFSYRPGDNLGFKIITMPLEDIIYGIPLMLSNIAFMEYFHYRSIVRKLKHIEW